MAHVWNSSFSAHARGWQATDHQSTRGPFFPQEFPPCDFKDLMKTQWEGLHSVTYLASNALSAVADPSARYAILWYVILKSASLDLNNFWIQLSRTIIFWMFKNDALNLCTSKALGSERTVLMKIKRPRLRVWGVRICTWHMLCGVKWIYTQNDKPN